MTAQNPPGRDEDELEEADHPAEPDEDDDTSGDSVEDDALLLVLE